jgi:hypothetical protein
MLHYEIVRYIPLHYVLSTMQNDYTMSNPKITIIQYHISIHHFIYTLKLYRK